MKITKLLFAILTLTSTLAHADLRSPGWTKTLICGQNTMTENYRILLEPINFETRNRKAYLVEKENEWMTMGTVATQENACTYDDAYVTCKVGGASVSFYIDSDPAQQENAQIPVKIWRPGLVYSRSGICTTGSLVHGGVDNWTD